MRILQLHAGYRTPAGEDTVVDAEAAALRRAGHDVQQAVEHNPPGAVAALRALSKSRYNRTTAARVDELCREWRPDVVHVHNTWFAQSSSVIEAAAKSDIPIVMTIHNYRLGCLGVDLFRGNSICTACVGRSPIRGVIHGCYRDSRVLSAVAAFEITSTRRRSTLDLVNRFVAPSAFMGDRLIDIGVPSDRLTVKPHFTSDPGQRAEAPSRSNEVLFIGRLSPAKGISTLLRAWERYADAATGIEAPHLTVIGDGPMAAEAHESAPRGVEFTGWLQRDEVQQRMLEARAFVFPSEWYEPFGMVLIEAMAAGLPVVSTTASDAARITGTPSHLVAPAGDERALATCLAQLDDETVDAAGSASRQRFLERYDEPVGVKDLERLYESVLAGESAAPLLDTQ